MSTEWLAKANSNFTPDNPWVVIYAVLLIILVGVIGFIWMEHYDTDNMRSNWELYKRAYRTRRKPKQSPSPERDDGSTDAEDSST